MVSATQDKHRYPHDWPYRRVFRLLLKMVSEDSCSYQQYLGWYLFVILIINLSRTSSLEKEGDIDFEIIAWWIITTLFRYEYNISLTFSVLLISFDYIVDSLFQKVDTLNQYHHYPWDIFYHEYISAFRSRFMDGNPAIFNKPKVALFNMKKNHISIVLFNHIYS